MPIRVVSLSVHFEEKYAYLAVRGHATNSFFGESDQLELLNYQKLLKYHLGEEVDNLVPAQVAHCERPQNDLTTCVEAISVPSTKDDCIGLLVPSSIPVSIIDEERAVSLKTRF